MDLQKMSPEGAGKAESAASIEYKGHVKSTYISGEIKVKLDDDGVIIASLMDFYKINYADFNSLSLNDYAVTICTDDGETILSHMGNWCEPLYKEMYAGYNKKVSKALFVKDDPIIAVGGEYSYEEYGNSRSGSGIFQVHENGVLILSPDTNARFIPFCFLTEIAKGNYDISLKIDEDEVYTLSKLGQNLDPFLSAIEKQIHEMQEKSLEEVTAIDKKLPMPKAIAIARRMPKGVMTSIGKLSDISSSFVETLEEKIKDKAFDAYGVLKKISIDDSIYVGFKKNESSTTDISAAISGVIGDLAPNVAQEGEPSVEEAEPQQDEYNIFIIAPSKDNKACAVEFFGDKDDSAATFIYRFDESFETFAKKLNKALVAIDFKREVIRLSDEELKSVEHMDYRMAVKRNAALRFVRSKFVGRAIHRSIDSWEKKVLELFSTNQLINDEFVSDVDVKESFECKGKVCYCGQCGAKVVDDSKFCCGCGAKLL